MYDNWFLQTGLMDVVRTLLVFGLIFAIWELPAPGLIKRPVRDFVHWGLKYPFLFLVMAAVTLIVWGVIGAITACRSCSCTTTRWCSSSSGSRCRS